MYSLCEIAYWLPQQLLGGKKPSTTKKDCILQNEEAGRASIYTTLCLYMQAL